MTSNNVFAGELAKMPKLFTHYFHHAQEHGDVRGFVDFLQKHYAGGHGSYAENDRHEEDAEDCKLPFKRCGNCGQGLHSSSVGFISSYAGTDFISHQTKTSYLIQEDKNIPSQHRDSIWQPPKRA